MGAASKIEWTWTRVSIARIDSDSLRLAFEIGAVQLDDQTLLVPGYTFNGWIGCTKVSPGCANCYAAQQDAFRSWTPEGWGAGKPRKHTSKSYWLKAGAWNVTAGRLGIRQRVFCSSLADVFDDEVPIGWLAELFYLILRTPNLDWLLLTKRPQNWKARVAAVAQMYNDQSFSGVPLHPEVLATSRWASDWLVGNAPANVWVGTTVEDQVRAEERIPLLISIPARVRFLSCEPMLGPVDLEYPESLFPGGPSRCCSGIECGCQGMPTDPPLIYGINWVICGGESGPGARPMHPDWARSLRDQCTAASIPFLFKQWGEWYPAESDGETVTVSLLQMKGQPHVSGTKNPAWHTFPGGQLMARIGKSAAGRHLDGVEHNGAPEVRA